jgi:PD-(D/E)XK endonuclease
LPPSGPEEVTHVCRTSYLSGYRAPVVNLSTSGKGAAAEAEIAAALIRLGLVVLRPLCEGGRYDLVLDTGEDLLRVQCKWASRTGNVLAARCVTSRHTPSGYCRSTYDASEIDALAAYAPDTDSCYLIPASEIEGRKQMSLRLAPTRNNQAAGLHWAQDYELEASLERNWSVTFR